MARDESSQGPPHVRRRKPSSEKAKREKKPKGVVKPHVPNPRAKREGVVKPHVPNPKSAAPSGSYIPREAQEAMEEAEKRKKEAAKEEAKRAKTYVVKSGDSLSKIAKALLGDAARWPEIFQANKDQIKDPNLIYPGQELRIP